MKLSLQFKFAICFFAVMLASAVISLTVLVLIMRPVIIQNSQTQILSIVNSMKQLEKLEMFTNKEIISLCVTDDSQVQTLEPKSTKYYLVKIEAAEQNCYFEQDGIIPSITGYTVVNDEYIKINAAYTEDFYLIAFFIIAITLIACIVIGTLLTTLVSSGILKPIRNLSAATNLVARGNFKVRVPVPRDRDCAVLTKNFNKMTEELSGIETLRGDFISNVSHEFKTPLASIQGFAKLLDDESISEEERKEYTAVIISETERLSRLTSDILKLSKLENQKTIVDKKRFSIDEQIRKILLVLEPEWTKKNIEMDISLDDVYYFGNEELMAQIWQNVINNAIKFTPKDGKIGVKLFCTESNITVKISDSGPTIDPDTAEKIFDKFYQGDRSRKTEGNGLGLALVKRIVDLCNGKIYMENMYDGGVCFVIELPYVIGDMM
ncbi:MAG: HAMP domain-containing histidine kinase [Ruminococcus sp.]|nr:HAMP domain-containing histidine kinase [Ruminococcus sp.]